MHFTQCIPDHIAMAVDPYGFTLTVDPAVIHVVGVFLAPSDLGKAFQHSRLVSRVNDFHHFRGAVGFAAIDPNVIMGINVAKKPADILLDPG